MAARTSLALLLDRALRPSPACSRERLASKAMEETERGDPGGDVPALSALAELREPDPRSMRWIVGGAAAPEAAAENHKRVMTQLDVPDSVPDAWIFRQARSQSSRLMRPLPLGLPQ